MNRNNHNEMNKNNDDFQQLWERRKQARPQNVPDDATVLEMARRAFSASAVPEETIIPVTIRRRGRWIPYAAAASLIAGISIIGLTRQNGTTSPLPVAQEVNVNGHTMLFLCNNGCSAQDVLLSANEVIKQ